MTQNVVQTRAKRTSIRDALNGIPKAARGGGSAAQQMMLRVGMALLGRIKQAFIAKARGGTDEAGDRWIKLKPSTIAYSRRGRTRTEKKRDAYPSQALNTRQQARWWDLYRQGLAIYKGDKGSAAKRAWGILKKEGAVTLFQKYSNRQVEILRDTGILLNSLSPGVKSPHQILRAEAGAVTIGTNARYAKFHHEGTRRMPKRRLWPHPSKWPATWWQDVADQMKQGLIDITVELIRSAA